MASKKLSSIADLFVSFHFTYIRKMLMNLNEKVIIQQNTIVLGSYMANDHLIEFHLIEIVNFHLIESFN